MYVKNNLAAVVVVVGSLLKTRQLSFDVMFA